MKVGFIKVFFTFLTISLISSCSINEGDEIVMSYSEGERIAQDLQLTVNENGISSAFVYEYRWNDNLNEYDWEIVSTISAEFKIEGSFIKVGNYYYNLENLHKYTFSNSVVHLYFVLEE